MITDYSEKHVKGRGPRPQLSLEVPNLETFPASNFLLKP